MNKAYLENIKDNLSFKTGVNDERFLNLILTDKKFFCETFLYIRDKNKKLIPFIFNEPQNIFYKNMTNYAIILKYRQLGMSTLLLAINFIDTILNPYTTTVVVAHNIESSIRLFDTVKIFYEYLPDILKPPVKYSNRKELYFKDSNNTKNSLESKIYVGAATNKQFGRGTTINNLHLSEFAFYPHFDLDGLIECVPINNESKIFIESTPNGLNEFYTLYMDAKAGKNIYSAYFFPWYMQKEYEVALTEEERKNFNLTQEEKELMQKYKLSLEKIKWRRTKISVPDGLKKFKMNYPTDDISCFFTENSTEFGDIDLSFLNDNLTKELPNLKAITNKISPNIDCYELPLKDYDYFMGVDVSENGKTSYSAIEVFRVDFNENKYVQVLEYADKVDVNTLTQIAYKIAVFYNNALIIPERNNDGKTFINLLLTVYKYPDIYQDKKNVYGFITVPQSKSEIISGLKNLLYKKLLKLYSKDLIEEIRQYDRFSPGIKGNHFDRLIATMIVLYIMEKHYYNLLSDTVTKEMQINNPEAENNKIEINLLDLEKDLGYIEIK